MVLVDLSEDGFRRHKQERRIVGLARYEVFFGNGLDMDGHFDCSTAASEARLCLVMGSEGKGMRRLTREACDEIIAIQMADSSESLNVSVAAAIIMHQTQFNDG